MKNLYGWKVVSRVCGDCGERFMIRGFRRYDGEIHEEVLKTCNCSGCWEVQTVPKNAEFVEERKRRINYTARGEKCADCGETTIISSYVDEVGETVEKVRRKCRCQREN